MGKSVGDFLKKLKTKRRQKVLAKAEILITQQNLMDAIRGYKSEWENCVPCAVMKEVYRKRIFGLYEKLKRL